jgi:alkanesulfonate monooxygenase SsuD/methylene tetrahydromethanopterin reductase-like flavin-dependent oxidoreductase (luciferase family)
MLSLTLSLSLNGFHPASSQAAPPSPNGAGLYPIAEAAERASLDAIILGMPTDNDAMQLDALPLAGALIGRTRRIGVVAGWTVDFTEPFHVARVMATMDHLSYGRTGWLAEMFQTDRIGPRIGRSLGVETPADYCERAAEFINAARTLWDSWEDEAFVIDKTSGMFTDPDRVHPIHHQGRFFTIRGPLNVPRPPQGNPVLVAEDPESVEARRFVASVADVVLTACPSFERALLRYRELRGMATQSPRILANLLVVLADTEPDAQRRAEALDAQAPSLWRGARFVGTPAQLVDLVAGWHAAGACDGFNLLPAVLPGDADLICRAVVPIAQERGVFRRAYTGTLLREHLGLQRPRSPYTNRPA